MIDKDYLLRIAAEYGRIIAIVLGLRQQNKHAEALAYLDNLLQQTTGLSSDFINSLTEEALLRIFSPLGTLNTQTCLWAASLLKAEGTVYEDLGNTTQSYYRYRKSLYLLISAILIEPMEDESQFYTSVDELLEKLSEYELPDMLKEKLFAYYEHIGKYDKAEDTLFELLATAPARLQLREKGQDFYNRLLKKPDEELQAGNFSLEEAQEGLEQVQAYPNA